MAKVEMGEAYILRTCAEDMTSRDGAFTWPASGMVEAPDWLPTAECGNGLHGFLWGVGDGDLADWGEDAVWIIAKVCEWIDLAGKVKFPRAEVVFCGSRADATAMIVGLGTHGAVVGSTLTGGDGSTLTGGYGSTLTGGDDSTLTGGDGSRLTGGDGSTLTGGDGSRLTGGDGSTLTGGDGSTLTGGDGSTLTGGYCSTLTGGYSSTLTGGDDSTLTALWWDGQAERCRVAVGYVGEDGIAPGVAYRVEGGKLVAVVAASA
jgi:hypothetical protein